MRRRSRSLNRDLKTLRIGRPPKYEMVAQLTHELSVGANFSLAHADVQLKS